MQTRQRERRSRRPPSRTAGPASPARPRRGRAAPTTSSHTARPATCLRVTSNPPPASARPTISATGAISAAVWSNLPRDDRDAPSIGPFAGVAPPSPSCRCLLCSHWPVSRFSLGPISSGVQYPVRRLPPRPQGPSVLPLRTAGEQLATRNGGGDQAPSGQTHSGSSEANPPQESESSTPAGRRRLRLGRWRWQRGQRPGYSRQGFEPCRKPPLQQPLNRLRPRKATAAGPLRWCRS